jgi:hypothetical protein
MTLNKLFIFLLILMTLVGAGIFSLWEYAYTPQGRARNVISQYKKETTGLRAWLYAHGLIRREVDPKWDEQPESESQEGRAETARIDRLKELGPDALPAVFEALGDDDQGEHEHCEVHNIALQVCGDSKDARAIKPLIEYMRKNAKDMFYTDNAWYEAIMNLHRNLGAVQEQLRILGVDCR